MFTLILCLGFTVTNDYQTRYRRTISFVDQDGRLTDDTADSLRSRTDRGLHAAQ